MKVPNKIAGWIILATLVVAVIVFVWIRHKPSNYNDPHLFQYGVHVVDSNTDAMSQTARQKYLDRAVTMRNDWYIWASEHKRDMRDLKASTSAQSESFRRVMTDLPEPGALNRKTTGIVASDFDSEGIIFSWQLPLTHVQPVENAKMASQQSKGLDWLQKRINQNAEEYHDIELAESVSLGCSRIVLWVSGRITETTFVQQHVPGKPTFVENPPKELYPAFTL